MQDMVRVVVDAMGGDNAPQEIGERRCRCGEHQEGHSM